MTLDDAYLYLGIPFDASLDEIENAYRIKISIYDPSRFDSNTPEIREARKMRASIEIAYDCILESLFETEENENQKNNSWLMTVVGVAALIVLLFAGFVVFYKNPENPVVSKRIERKNNNDNNSRMIINAVQEAFEKKNDSGVMDYANLVEKVMPSIVRIKTEKSTGSGFFVSSNGDILTNHHVVKNAQNIIIIPSKGEASYALVKDFDAEKDVALLVINTSKPTPFLKISSVLPRQGEAIMAIGNPRGLEGTVSNGIVSAFRKNNTWVQFTAPVSPGSSGGALINSRGEVVGMTTMLLEDGQNLNFAIAPTVLTKFFNSARNKAPQTMTRIISRKPEVPSQSNNDPELAFVRKDEAYEIYLDTGHINYDKESQIVSFLTIWYPSEKTKKQMERDPNFNITPGKNIGLCALLYMADFSDNTYVHLRTINFYTDGSIARDYIRPRSESKWENPKTGSRIESLIQELKRILG